MGGITVQYIVFEMRKGQVSRVIGPFKDQHEVDLWIARRRIAARKANILLEFAVDKLHPTSS